MPVLGCLAAGPHTAFANVQPSPRKIRRGDIIRFDVGGRYNHYRADIARNAVLGEPSHKLATYHRAIRAGLLRAIEMVKPGVRAADIFEQAVETVRREGIPTTSETMSVTASGSTATTRPTSAPSSKEVLEEGMVVCLETPYYELGFGGLQVEDMIRVTADGFRIADEHWQRAADPVRDILKADKVLSELSIASDGRDAPAAFLGKVNVADRAGCSRIWVANHLFQRDPSNT